ncbi:EAL domain-containing protein [Hydrogenobacter hydrogenophilus]|uniref:EAL domain, c-di-GMP-specific phosphodiesterase class I (Or its enzymatically inactive variant) n=1 Tax=Hydrogenobacter hydrogenophilus TaxID=35835 RepID=A0A285P6J4_9AQUI|nr:EAL domain-containing protein [Hydrogenobacter hydrogenophilus]SNZ16783.1 EAL domain, c-di-GMP-specific phosphodiesterase class I (or its enzymatically inactive variant) [Hydrogenobacter hydrogenophilus]
MLYVEDRKNLKVYALLENVVELDTGNLHGYRVVSRVLYGDEEVSFTEIANRDLKMKIEMAVLEALKSLDKKGILFINLPISINIESLPLYGKNLVVNLPMGMGLKNLYIYRNRVKKCGLGIALDDFTTIGYELKDLMFGAFDYVFFSDEFYTKAKKEDVKRAVELVKYYGSKVCFKKIDTTEKLELANRLGAQLGHGFMFGYEQIKAHI